MLPSRGRGWSFLRPDRVPFLHCETDMERQRRSQADVHTSRVRASTAQRGGYSILEFESCAARPRSMKQVVGNWQADKPVRYSLWTYSVHIEVRTVHTGMYTASGIRMFGWGFMVYLASHCRASPNMVIFEKKMAKKLEAVEAAKKFQRSFYSVLFRGTYIQMVSRLCTYMDNRSTLLYRILTSSQSKDAIAIQT